MTDLLSEVEYGRILGSFTAVAEDFGDTVAPDAVPLTGTVLFTPSVSHVSYVNSAGETASLYVSPVSASITSGRLVGSDGKDGVTLLASNSNNVSASVLWNASISINPLGPDQEAPETYNFLIEVRRNEISSLIDVIKANSRVHNVALFHDAIAEAAAKFWERVEAGEFRGNQGPPGPAGVGVGVPGPEGRPGIIGKDGDPGVGGNLLPDGDLEEPGFLVTGDYQETSDAASGSKAVKLTNATSRKIRLEPETSYVGTVYLKSPEASTATITMRVFGSEGDIDRVIENAYDLPADSWRKVTFLLDSNLGDQSMEIITASDGRTISADLYTLSDNSVVQGLQRDLSAAQAQLEAAMAQLDLDLAEVEANRVILGESLKDLAVVLEDADVDLTELNQQMADLKSDLAAEETKRQEADAAAQLILNQLDTNLAQARTDLDANAVIIGQLDTDLAQSLVDLEASKAKMDTLENVTLPGLRATLEEADRQARADLDTLSGLLSGLDTALRENDQTIEELTTTILPGLRTRLEENTTALSGMDTTLSQAKTDLEQISTDLATERDERIAAVGAAQGTITELDGKLSTAFPDGPFNVPNELAQTIYRSDVQYAVSSSETVAPTTGWSGDSPTREPGEFVWFRTVVTYGDGTTATSGAALMTGNTGEAGRPGEKGDPGEDGTSVTIKGTLDSVSDLPASGDAGDSYLVGGYLYIWSGSWENVGLIRGPQGVPGEPGDDGEPTYTWVKYADTSTGLGMSDDPAGKRYLGLAHNKADQTESTNASDYQWALFEGPEGPQGLEGPPGENGESLYTWLKYADSPTTGMSDSPVGKKYMGIAYNKTTPNESTTYSDYTWALIEGEQGVRGPAGANGQTTYTWVKYGTSATGEGMSDSPEGKTYIGLAYNKTTQTESTVPGDYTWSLIQGPKGDKGTTGDQGVSVESITPHYRQEESSAPKPSQPSGMAPAGWSAEEPLWAQNTSLWRAERVIYSNDVISWTPVTLVSAHTGIDKAIIDAREAHNEAVKAQEDATEAMERSMSPSANMIFNGNGSKGMTNFEIASGFWRRYPDDSPAGAQASYGIEVPTGAWLDQTIAVDPSRRYRMVASVRQANPDFVPGVDRFYMALSPMDSDGLDIATTMYARWADTLTTLAADLKPGDTSVTLSSPASWNAATPNKAVAVYDYTDGSGKHWGTEYTRIVLPFSSVSGAVVSLNSAWSGRTIAAGTPVAQALYGGAYVYPAVPTGIPHEWTAYESVVLGGVHDPNGAVATYSFPAPTTSVRPGFLFNYTNQTESRHRIANVGFFDVTEAVAAQARADEAHALAASKPDMTEVQQAITASANGKNSVVRSAVSPNKDGSVAGDTWYRVVDVNTVGSEIAKWVWDGVKWVKSLINSEMIEYLDVLKVTGQDADFRKFFAEKLTANEAVIDDLWAKTFTTHKITANELTIASVDSSGNIESGAVGAVQIANGAVSADKITSGAITTEKLDALAITAGKIAANAITTEKIAAKAINASKIAANTITASEINSESVAAEVGKFLKLNVGSLVASDAQVDSAVIDRLWADGIAARTGTFNSLSVSNSNAYIDPSLSMVRGWNQSMYSPTGGKSGGGSIVVESSSGSDTGSYEHNGGPRLTKVEPGRVYRVGAWMKSSVTSSASLGRINYGYRNSIGSIEGAKVLTYSGPLEADTWKWVEGEITVPEGMYELYLGFYNSVPAGVIATVTYSDPLVSPLTGTVHIENGAVNAEKVNAESVGAAVGEFVKLDVKNLTAGSANINSLVAQKIAAGTAAFQTVNADKIIASTGTMDSAVINQIWADGIAAKAITTNKLTVATGNIVPDGDEMITDEQWTSSSIRSIVDKPDQVIASRTFPAGSGGSGIGNEPFPVTPGQEYSVQMWIKASKPNSRFYMEVRAANGSGTHAGTGQLLEPEVACTGSYLLFSNRLVPTVWTLFRGTWTPNSDVSLARLGTFYFNHSNGTERTADISIAGLSIKPKVGAVLIENGAISANHLTSNSVDTDHLRANAVDAGKIKAGAVTTAKMTANSINGDRIQANTLHAGKILANSITASKIASKTITASEIKARTILAENIVSGTITANEIKARTITAAEIKAGAIEAEHLNVSGEFIGNMISGEHIYGTVIEGGEFRTTSSLPGQVRIADDGFVYSGRRVPGIEITPEDTKYTVLPAGVGPWGEGASIFGGVDTSNRTAQIFATPRQAGITSGGSAGDGRLYVQASGISMSTTRASDGDKGHLSVNYTGANLTATDGESGEYGRIMAEPRELRMSLSDGSGNSPGQIRVIAGTTSVSATAPDGRKAEVTTGPSTGASLSYKGADGVTRTLQVNSGGVWVKTNKDGSRKNYNLEETAQDSGWHSIQVLSGYTAQPDYAPRARKVGNLIYLSGGIKGSGISANTAQNVMRLPESFRPARQSIYMVGGSSSARSAPLIVVQPDGIINLRTAPDVGGYYLMDGLSFIPE